jgi:hypothetical protein
MDILKCIYNACSKKNRTFAIKTLFYNILSTVPFKVVPSTGDTPSPTFLPLLECFLKRTFYDGAQFSYRIFLNLRVFKIRPNFLNSAPASTVCCQNQPLGALSSRSAPSVLVGALFKKFGLFFEHRCILGLHRKIRGTCRCLFLYIHFTYVDEFDVILSDSWGLFYWICPWRRI